MKKLLLLSALSIFGVLGLSAADIHINNQDYSVDTLVVKHRVGPGTTYAYYRVPSRPLEIHVLEMDLTNPYFNMEVWNGGRAAVACETPSSVGRRYTADGVDVIAVHNGDFFTTNLGETGISRMGLIGAGEVIFNPTGNVLFCMDNEGLPRIDYVNFAGTATRADGVTNRIHTVNQLRLEWEPASHPYQLSLYTPAFGTQMNVNSTGGTVAAIRPVAGSNIYPVNTDLVMEVVSVGENTGRMAIPADGALLHGVNSAAEFLNGLKPGETVTLHLGATMPSYPDVKTIHDAIGGSGHIILRNGQITNINNPDCHPRTFMGISQDSKTIYSVVIDGRYGSSAGIDLDDQGRVLQWLGAWDGINLDGGGSSCMVVNGITRNHTSDGPERAVGNGVIFYSTAPKDDVVADIQFAPGHWQMPVGATVTPGMFGFNKYDYLVDMDFSDFTLTCSPDLGTVSEDGHTFVASTKPTSGKLTATSGTGLTAEVDVDVYQVTATSDFDTYIVDNRRDYPLLLTSKYGPASFAVDASTMAWTSADENVAAVKAGTVRGVADGTTTLTATSDHFNGSVTVTTENPPLSGERAIVAAADITTKQTGGTGMTVEAFGDNGFTATYTGNGSGRGSYIQFNDKDGASFVTYGLPDAIEITINPGDAPVNQIRLNYSDNHGNRSAISLADTPLEANKEVTITKSLSDILDVTDNSLYPISFAGLRFEMGVSAKNTEYTITVPSFVYRYDGKDAVNDITVDKPAATAGDTDAMYRLDGTLAPANPAPGIYIKADGTKTLVK